MTWLLPALTFIAGVALGAVVVAVGSSGNDGGGTTASPPTPAPAPVGPSPARSDLVVKIPGVCLDAIDSAEEATREVDDLVSAVRAFDAARLQALVDRFQELEVTIRASAEGCREVTGERLEDGVGAPSPTAAP